MRAAPALQLLRHVHIQRVVGRQQRRSDTDKHQHGNHEQGKFERQRKALDLLPQAFLVVECKGWRRSRFLLLERCRHQFTPLSDAE